MLILLMMILYSPCVYPMSPSDYFTRNQALNRPIHSFAAENILIIYVEGSIFWDKFIIVTAMRTSIPTYLWLLFGEV
jgi:hypothetical protein